MSRELSVVIDGYTFLESPRWWGGRLWVSDFYTNQVVATDVQGNVEVMAEVPNQPSGLGRLPDGRELIVSLRDHRLLRREPDGELVEHADLSGLMNGIANDMVVDAEGRAYVGNFGFDLMGGAPMSPTVLVRVDPDGTASVVADDMHFPNGSVIMNGDLLVVSETFGNRLTAFDIAADGGLSGRRAWASFGDLPDTDDVTEALGMVSVGPDGMCADVEGAVWIADALNNRVLRVREGGEIVEEVSTGDLGTYACMLGGDDGRTLFMCSAPSFVESERRAAREAKILSCQVDVPHTGLP